MNKLLFDKRSKNAIYCDYVKRAIVSHREKETGELQAFLWYYHDDYNQSSNSRIKNESLLNCAIIVRELIKRGLPKLLEIEKVKGIIKPLTINDLQRMLEKLKINAKTFDLPK